MANRIILNEISYHGKGAILSVTEEAKLRGFKKAFVCSDPDLVKFNVTKKVTDLLDKEGLEYEIYSDIKANPTIENVQSGVEAFKKSGADYIIKVSGDSMQPTFEGGDKVYVKKTYELNYGDIGIFQRGNELFIKEYRKDGMISHNKKYKIIKDTEDVIIVGKVLGKVEE